MLHAILNQSPFVKLQSNYIAPSWNCIWSIHLQSKVTCSYGNCQRTLCPHYIGSLYRLRQRYVDVGYLCPICDDSTEDPFHALLGCSFVFSIWDEVLGEGWATSIASITSWWELLQGKDNDTVQKVAYICLAIWARRNNYLK